MDEENPRILRHSRNDGVSAIYENGYITIIKGEWKMRVSRAIDVPLTKGGKALYDSKRIGSCFSYLLTRVFIEDIKVGIESFIPSPFQTPGRLNMFNFDKFDVLLDYVITLQV